jgi:hypothetical protein
MSSNPNIHSVKEMAIDYAKVTAYGPPGSGKTTFGATFPNVLFLSAESGLLSIRDRDIDAWTINEWEDMEEAFKFLKHTPHEYKSVAVDSVSEIQKKLNDYIVRKFPAVKRGYQDLPSESDWGANISKMRQMLRAFRDLPMNVLFICLSQDTDLDGEAITRPALSGKTLPDELVGWCDACLYCPGPQKDDEGNQRYLGQTIPAKGRRAKIRVPAGATVPAVIPLTFEALHRAMFPEKHKPRAAKEAAA